MSRETRFVVAQNADVHSPGGQLRAARVAQSMTVAQAAQALRTREAVVIALENDEYGLFSADMYARGFIRNYARIVGIDAAPLLASYQEQHAKNDPDVLLPAAGDTTTLTLGVQPRRSVKGLIIAAVLVLVMIVAVTSVVLGGRTPDTATVDDMVDLVPEPAETPDPVTPDVEPDQAPEPEPVTGVDLVLAFEQASWMQILVDGVLVLEETVPAGETLQYRGEEIRVRFGNAGGVFAELNGEDLGIQGARGEVRNVRYTRDGADVS